MDGHQRPLLAEVSDKARLSMQVLPRCRIQETHGVRSKAKKVSAMGPTWSVSPAVEDAGEAG